MCRKSVGWSGRAGEGLKTGAEKKRWPVGVKEKLVGSKIGCEKRANRKGWKWKWLSD